MQATTGFGPHFAKVRETWGAPTVALLPIGAYAPEWFMERAPHLPRRAVLAHQILGAKQSYGIHWGTFDLSNEGEYEPAAALRSRARREATLASRVRRARERRNPELQRVEAQRAEDQTLEARRTYIRLRTRTKLPVLGSIWQSQSLSCTSEEGRTMRGSGVYTKADSLATRALMVVRDRFPSATLRSELDMLGIDGFDVLLLATEFERATRETANLEQVCAARTVLDFVNACAEPARQVSAPLAI